MKRICGWCHASLGEVEAAGSEEKVTAGICGNCAEFFKTNHPQRPLSSFLNSLPVPVAVLSSEHRIEFANEEACELLGKKFEDFKGFLGGDAFECAQARLPGGCGKTEHCKACAIRLTVMKTYETGEGQESISASLKVNTPDGLKDVRYIISTKKLGDVVLLRVDQT